MTHRNERRNDSNTASAKEVPDNILTWTLRSEPDRPLGATEREQPEPASSFGLREYCGEACMTPVKTCRLQLVTFILAHRAIAEQIPGHEPGGEWNRGRRTGSEGGN
jgi:hypothetical protein